MLCKYQFFTTFTFIQPFMCGHRNIPGKQDWGGGGGGVISKTLTSSQNYELLNFG